MPVKRATAKKTVAKKTAAKKPTGTAAAKKTAEVDPAENIAKNVSAAIVEGKFDRYLVLIDDALTTRINKQNAEAAKKTAEPAPAKTERKVSTPPKRAKKSIVPEVGKNYLVSDSSKNIGGARVKFKRTKVDAPEKAVVEMVTDKPGYPKGKLIVLPVAYLEEVPARTARTKRK